MAGKALTIEQILSIFTETPTRLAALTADLTGAQLRTVPKQGEWSANDILAHLRSCSDVWGNSMMTIIAQDRPTIRAINPRTWINSTNYLDLEFQPSREAFTTQRNALLAILKSLPPDDWNRTVIVTGAGKPLELTVLSYGQRMARHERPHVKQIESIVKQLRK